MLLLALLAFPSTVFAHRLDEYLQATLVNIETNSIRLQINLTPGVEVAGPVLALIDLNHDGNISADEAQAYASTVKSSLTLRLDGQALELKVTAADFPPLEELRTGRGIIQLEFSVAPGALAPGSHELAFENRHLTLLSVYLINAALPKTPAVQIIRQIRNGNQSEGRIEFTIHASTATVPGTKRIVPWLILALVALCSGTIIWRGRKQSAP